MRPDRWIDAKFGLAAHGVLRRAARNFGAVIAGQAMGTLLGFLALTLNTRALGPEQLGVLFLVQATGEMALAICSFQNWRMVIKFGAAAIAAGDGPGLRAIWRFGFLLDVLTAACAASAVLALFLVAPHWVGLSETTGQLGAFYALTLGLSFAGSSIGMLRLCNRFGVVVWVEVMSAVLLCLNAAVLCWSGAGIESYLLTIPVVTAIGPVLLTLMGWLRMRRVAATLTERPDGADYAPRAMLRFAIGSSGATTLNAFQNKGEFLIVGSLLGPAAGALFGVAYRFAAIFARFADAGRQSVYPEMGHLIASGHFDTAAHLAARLARLAALIAVPALLLLGLFGREILTLFFGPAYAAALPNMMLISAGMAVGTVTFALEPLIQLRWGAARFFWLNLAAFAAFVGAAVAGPLFFGEAGAGAGRLGFSVLLALLSIRLIYGHRNTRAEAASCDRGSA